MTPNEKSLIRRYLLWCYKTTKEELDRIDRKFTQLKVDQFVLTELTKIGIHLPVEFRKLFEEKVDAFCRYMGEKENSALGAKFSDPKKRTLQIDYVYLTHRLSAVEKAIVKFLSSTELKKIKGLYEEEMSRRILAEREHR